MSLTTFPNPGSIYGLDGYNLMPPQLPNPISYSFVLDAQKQNDTGSLRGCLVCKV